MSPKLKKSPQTRHRKSENSLLLCRSAGVEQLMYIKEDLIIPHVSADKPIKSSFCSLPTLILNISHIFHIKKTFWDAFTVFSFFIWSFWGDFDLFYVVKFQPFCIFEFIFILTLLKFSASQFLRLHRDQSQRKVW